MQSSASWSAKLSPYNSISYSKITQNAASASYSVLCSLYSRIHSLPLPHRIQPLGIHHLAQPSRWHSTCRQQTTLNCQKNRQLRLSDWRVLSMHQQQLRHRNHIHIQLLPRPRGKSMPTQLADLASLPKVEDSKLIDEIVDKINEVYQKVK